MCTIGKRTRGDKLLELLHRIRIRPYIGLRSHVGPKSEYLVVRVEVLVHICEVSMRTILYAESCLQVRLLGATGAEISDLKEMELSRFQNINADIQSFKVRAQIPSGLRLQISQNGYRASASAIQATV